MTRVALLACGWVVVLTGCFGQDTNVTESGEGRPVVSVDFPPTVEPGTRATAEFEIENPGPGDMSALSLAFALVGDADLPDPLVGLQTEAIIDVAPQPDAISRDGAVYVFDGLEEGESASIEFTIRVPREPGYYANSVTASDGSLDRSRGVRLETQVER